MPPSIAHSLRLGVLSAGRYVVGSDNGGGDGLPLLSADSALAVTFEART